MVTDGKRKLVWNFSDRGEFYDLERDPYELVNRFYDPEMRGLRDQYFSILLQEAKRLEDGQTRYLIPEVEDTLAQYTGGPLSIRI